MFRTKNHDDEKGIQMQSKNKELERLYEDTLFIEAEMSFYSWQDFRRNANAIRNMYRYVEFRTKKLYKWYVYSRPMTSKQKNFVWEFLNNETNLNLEN